MAKESARAGLVTALLVICVARTFSQDLKIEPNVRKLLVATGSELELDCFVTTNEAKSPSYLRWTGPRDNFTTTTRTDNRLTYHSFLKIDSFTQAHVGTYTCTYAPNGDFTSRNDIQDTTIELFTVIENKKDADFFYGNKSAILECILDFPGASVKGTFREWLKDNTSLSQLKKPERFTDGENGTLFIAKPTREDAGLYIARYEVTGVEHPTHDCEVEYKATPLVLDLGRSKNEVEGSTLHLECEVKGYPIANVTWLRNDETIIKDGKRITTEEYKGHDDAKLIIKSASSLDAGKYTCLAADENGKTDSKSITVRVKDRLEWLWPVIGILCEAVVLFIVVFTCTKLKKDDHVEKPADEREGLLRQGSARNRDHDKHE